MLLLEEQRDVIDGAAMCVCKSRRSAAGEHHFREMSVHCTLERCLEPFTQCIKSIITCRHLFHLHVNDKTCWESTIARKGQKESEQSITSQQGEKDTTREKTTRISRPHSTGSSRHPSRRHVYVIRVLKPTPTRFQRSDPAIGCINLRFQAPYHSFQSFHSSILPPTCCDSCFYWNTVCGATHW